jgi:flagellar biosynthesis/type III secretory pathway protein FliH
VKSSRRVIKSNEVHWGAAITFRPPVAAVVPSGQASAPPPAQPEGPILPVSETTPAEVMQFSPVLQSDLPDPDDYRRGLLLEADAEKERLIEAARSQAAEIERLARAQAAEFEQLANEQAEQVVGTAKAQAAEVTSLARREGYEAAEADAGQLLLAAQGVLDEVRAWRATMFAQSEQSVLDLVSHIAQILFGQGIALEREALEAALNRAVLEAKPLGSLRVHVHPDDAALLNPTWAQQAAPTGQRLELVSDDAIRRGGSLVEGESGMVDARVETQLQLTLKALTADAPAEITESAEAPAV